MKLRFSLCVALFIILIPNTSIWATNNDIVIASQTESFDTYPYIHVLKSETEDLSEVIKDLRNNRFTLASNSKPSSNDSIYWIFLPIKNTSSKELRLKMNLTFSDYADVYLLNDSNVLDTKIHTGDIYSLDKRKVDNGQFVFVELQIPAGERRQCLVRIKNTRQISKQFWSFAFNSIKIYTDEGYTNRYTVTRIYQAFFYGAIIIMLVYNLLIFFSTRSVSYFHYVIFIFFLIVFLASNNGYALELLWPGYPTPDLYLRFLSAPLLLISYLFFSNSYLNAKTYTPKLSGVMKAISIVFMCIILSMCLGYWKIGRITTILLSVVSFMLVLIIAIRIYKKGFSPARYFLLANILLLAGGFIYATQRQFSVVHNPFTQYSLQIAAILQAALFSIGLADRINLAQRELVEVKLENEIEKKKIIEDKNEELQKINQELDNYIYKTAHDLRGPVARLMGLSQLAIKDVQDSQAVFYLEKLKHNSENLNYILNRLSRIYEINSIEVLTEKIDFHKLLEEIISDLKKYGEYVAPDISVDIQLEAAYYSDNRLIKFILRNLIENAVKFQKKDVVYNPIIHIFVHEQKGEIIIDVSDNGVGILKEDIPSLFEMFSRAADKYHSPGLGLYMVKICIEKLKGSIVLNADQSEFTQFKIFLPKL